MSTADNEPAIPDSNRASPQANDKILWIDCLGGLFAGIAMLSLAGWISKLESLPIEFVVGMGCANLAYGTYSVWVTLSRPRSQRKIEILAASNVAWLFVCLAIVVKHRGGLSPLGNLHVVGEGVYVAGLGIVEWRLRKRLVRPK